MGLFDWIRRRLHRRRKDSPDRVPASPSVPPGTSSLSGLLNALDEIAEAHPELLDTDVRERIWEVVEHRYVKLDPTYEIPTDLGMFSEQANGRLRSALEHHLKNLVTIADIFRLDTPAKRLRTLQNPSVKSEPNGHAYDYFLGSP
jgi:hypothetical protein